MNVQLLGYNHKTASLALREKLALATEKIPDALQHLSKQTGLQEAVLLSTCNRTEIYCINTLDTRLQEQKLLEWLSEYQEVSLDEIEGSFYSYHKTDAIKHIIRVASGLDSMVLGEPQILGQLKSAFAAAQQTGTISSYFNLLFQHIFKTAKRIRTETDIGKNPISFAFITIKLAQHIFSDISKTQVLLIGSGKITELILKHLKQHNVSNIVIANRSQENIHELANSYNIKTISLTDIPNYLPASDIIITSTASQLPLLGKGAIESALKERKHKPIFMVDLAVPRDIEPEVNELADVYLYNIDDLKTIIETNIESRESAVEAAEKIIEEEVNKFNQMQVNTNVLELLKNYRSQAEAIRDDAINKALQKLKQGESPEEIIHALAIGLTNKFIHKPSLELKKAGADDHHEKIDWFKALLNTQNNTKDQT